MIGLAEVVTKEISLFAMRTRTIVPVVEGGGGGGLVYKLQ